ncbi:DUF6894 family protein [Allosphingosinicella sp.]|jgi:hypothetical protein|uniref:DUF6894 family protein n=1 Tax=Allosphingosinicella sp. TaxID=2823234 RepID=UPI002EDE0975
MPAYFFHLKGDGLDHIDRCGSHYSGPQHARAQALWFAREALAEEEAEGRIPRRAYVQVDDEAGRSLFMLPLLMAGGERDILVRKPPRRSKA